MVRRCISRRRNDALVILETARTFGHSELPGNPRFRKEDVAPREMLVDEQALVSVPCEAHEDHLKLHPIMVSDVIPKANPKISTIILSKTLQRKSDNLR